MPPGGPPPELVRQVAARAREMSCSCYGPEEIAHAALQEAWAWCTRHDSEPLLVDMAYGSAELLCGGDTERRLLSGVKAASQCRAVISGGSLGEIRQSLADHLHHAGHAGSPAGVAQPPSPREPGQTEAGSPGRRRRPRRSSDGAGPAAR